MRRATLILALFALAVTACSGDATLAGGDAARQPEPVPRRVLLQVLAGDDLTPLDAAVAVDGAALEPDVDGEISFEWDEEMEGTRTVTAAASGFEPGGAELTSYPDEGVVELRLAPVVLRGRVITPDLAVLPSVEVSLGDRVATTDEEGRFTFVRAEAGELTLRRPAWAETVAMFDGSPGELDLTMEPRRVRALRVSGPKAGDAAAWGELLRLTEVTGVNALVVDVKDERGRVLHDTSVGRAHDIGAVSPLYDLGRIISDMDERELYKIARIAVFQDPVLAVADPTIAAWDTDSAAVWTTNAGEAWLDPSDPDAWGYALDLAAESCRRGFDEIQFDYVSFPFGGPVGSIRFDGFEAEDYYSAPAQQARTEIVAGFLAEAKALLNPLGCAIAANIFAILLESPTDEGVGHTPESLSPVVDVLSPTIYSHLYEPGWAGFDDPNEHAPEIVGIAVRSGLARMHGLGILRPWVQRAFLDPDEILAVQQEVEGSDLGWMLWSNAADFSADMLPPASQ